jgi:putative tryptophan/tyrosine transport system substrate-binding protein
MRRRDFIAGLGSTAAWPLAARAQQRAMPVIGFLNSQSPDLLVDQLRAFHQGLREADFIEGRNVAIEYRRAEGRYDRLSAMATDLVRRQVAVFATNGVAVAAAKAATTTIPIVFFAVAPDPLQAGLVASLNRPGGNVTGVNSMNYELVPKRMELLRELIPGATSIGFLVNPSTSLANDNTSETLRTELNHNVDAAARLLGLQVHVLGASNDRAVEDAFAKLVELRAGGLVVRPDPLFSSRVEKIAALALRHSIPTIYTNREFAAGGGLMGYGASQTDQYRLGGAYVGRILKGEKPADLPVQRVTKFELTINLKTAKALGLTIPETLLATADEVIQ